MSVKLEVGTHITILVRSCGGEIIKGILQDEKHCGKRHSNMIDAIESLVLAHACGGVDVEDAKYVEGVTTAIDACLNN